MESVAAQLSAAVYALVGGMLARFHDGPGYVGLVYRLNFARWGLEGASLRHHHIRLSMFHHALCLSCLSCIMYVTALQTL